jgi:hypothetical protein
MWIYPGTDLHVVRTFSATTFRVLVHDGWGRNAPWQDASTISGMEVTFKEEERTPATVAHTIPTLVGSTYVDPQNPLGPGIPSAVTVAPSATSGTSMFFATATSAGNDIDHGIFRVSTHDDVTALFQGDNGIHMFAQESNRVVAVVAQFSDGSIAEVTGHSWLSATSNNSSIATVDAECRIKAVAAGTTTITVKLADGRFPLTVPITVLPSLASGFGTSVIRDQLPLPKTARHTTTLYVLSEGYTDHQRFLDHATALINQFRDTSPYKELRDRFAAVGIFIPAPERGVTIGGGLAPAPPGSPSNARNPWTWGVAPLPQTFLRSRDTLLGVIFGDRWNPVDAPLNKASDKNYEDSYFADRVVPRGLGVDDRRLPRFGVDLPEGSASPTSFEPVPPEIGFSSFVRRYIEAAGYTVDARDRVVILIDDDFYGGLHIDVIGRKLDGLPTVAVSVGRNVLIGAITGSAPLFDRTPPVSPWNPDVQQRVAATLSHELAHSYQLGDEYQYVLAGQAGNFNPGPFEADQNTQHVKTLRRPGLFGPIRSSPPNYMTPLDPNRIKWNIVHRIVKASQALSITGVDSKFRLQLERHDARRWAVGEYVYLRTHALPWTTTTTTADPRYNVLSTQIAAVDLAADTVDLVVPIATVIIDYSPTPVLYVPKLGNLGVPLTLVDPAVVAFLALNGPFAKARAATLASPCDDPDTDGRMNDDEQPPANLANFNYPAVRARTIGLYEGAWHWACGVFRPSGRCKMRKSDDHDANGNYRAVDFCFVCQYTLVDLIDPSKHPNIDKNYPGGIR